MPAMSYSRWRGSQAPDGAPIVAVLPGANYPIDVPGLHLPSRALALAGWDVWRFDWGSARPSDPAQLVELVSATLDSFAMEVGTPDLVLAKSLGTFGARWVADRGVPAIWTTPLLEDPLCVSALVDSDAPALLIGGTTDPRWDEERVSQIGKPAVRIEGADHGWHTGDWRREIEVYAEVSAAVEDFAHSVVVA